MASEHSALDYSAVLANPRALQLWSELMQLRTMVRRLPKDDYRRHTVCERGRRCAAELIATVDAAE